MSANNSACFSSGFATDSIIKVLQGERVGTLFHKDANSWVLPKEDGAHEMAVAARDCSRKLQVWHAMSITGYICYQSLKFSAISGILFLMHASIISVYSVR